MTSWPPWRGFTCVGQPWGFRYEIAAAGATGRLLLRLLQIEQVVVNLQPFQLFCRSIALVHIAGGRPLNVTSLRSSYPVEWKGLVGIVTNHRSKCRSRESSSLSSTIALTHTRREEKEGLEGVFITRAMGP